MVAAYNNRFHPARTFFPMPEPRWRIPTLVLAFLGACADKGDDTGANVALPAETDTREPDVDSVALVPDTFDDGGDEEPAHWLSLRQEGVWELTPRGGPWTALTGALVATEILDEDEESPRCEVTYALTGEVVEAPGCDTCDAAFRVAFYVSEGDPDACADPDLPMEDEERMLGWSPVDDAIYLDYAGTGVWLPWYEGAADEDTITFSWTAELAIYVEEEEDE